jgi:cystathionine gamma-synthase
MSTTYTRASPEELLARAQEGQRHAAEWGRPVLLREWGERKDDASSTTNEQSWPPVEEDGGLVHGDLGEPAPEMEYGRVRQPTRVRAERIIGALEGGFALTYASGLAAVSAALHNVMPRRIALDAGYFASRNAVALYHKVLSTGANATSTSAPPPPLPPAPMSLDELRADLDAGGEGVDFIMIETPRNPDTRLIDIEECARLAQRCRPKPAVLLVDSTFASPVGATPLALGADMVLHSTTKILGGHSDALGGALVVRDRARAQRLLAERVTLGSGLGSMESWLLLRSLRTLELRVRRSGETALALAQWLEARIAAVDATPVVEKQGPARVARVWHCHLASHPDHAIARRQLHVPPYCFAMELACAEHAEHLAEHTRLFGNATSLGGCESLLDYRYRWDKSVSPCLIRISVGLEHIDDLTADLDRAFHAVAKGKK